jgi:Protein of unknown function (DUF992)
MRPQFSTESNQLGFAIVTVIAMIGISSLASTYAQTSGQTGALKCNVAGGWGLLIGSKKQMTCVYSPSGSGPKYKYTGTIGRLGIDIGRTKKSVMIWGVVASGKKSGVALKGDSIAGNYSGIGAEAGVIFGVGANALIGGSGKSIALQPLSVSGHRGTNLALGVQRLKLKFAGVAASK